MNQPKVNGGSKSQSFKTSAKDRYKLKKECMKKITSKKFNFVYEDLKKALFNAFVFGSPLLLIILVGIQSGKNFNDIKPLIIAWTLQTSIDLVKKFISTKTYRIGP